MSNTQIRPKGVTLDKQAHELRIDWGEDHISLCPLNALREACPCVVCRGGHNKMGQEFDPDLIDLQPAHDAHVQHVEMVGNYALQFWWEDGHNSGIYTWEYLYRICPCPICVSERASEPKLPRH